MQSARWEFTHRKVLPDSCDYEGMLPIEIPIPHPTENLPREQCDHLPCQVSAARNCKTNGAWHDREAGNGGELQSGELEGTYTETSLETEVTPR